MSAGLSPGLISLPDSTYTSRRQPDCGGRFAGRSSRADDRSVGRRSAPMPELTMPLRARCASWAATAPGSTQRPTPRAAGVRAAAVRSRRVVAGSVAAGAGAGIAAGEASRRPACGEPAPSGADGANRRVRPARVRTGRPGSGRRCADSVSGADRHDAPGPAAGVACWGSATGGRAESVDDGAAPGAARRGVGVHCSRT